jgi:hypothetical protein
MLTPPPSGAVNRRAFLVGSLAVAFGVPLATVRPQGARAQAPVLTGVPVRPRAEWAQGLEPTGPLLYEQPGDVRFLLVHHTASGNDYRPEEVPGLLRSFYSLHTGASKGWPDVAYNFFIDRYGTAWEGRAGSLEGPVMPDATGGSQGFAQLCCFVGDHTAEAPTPEARRSMAALLASLAKTYGIDPAPGATASFISRGSNRWPAGVPVTTTTIAGHRDMSLTLCPGDAAYALVRTEFPMQASALMAARPTSPPASSRPASGAAATRAARRARDGDGSPDASAWMAGATVSGGLAALTAVVLRRPRTPPRPDAAHGEAPPTGCDELGQL